MMPYYPARDGHPSIFTLDENTNASTGEPIHSTIPTSGRVLRSLYAALGTLRHSPQREKLTYGRYTGGNLMKAMHNSIAIMNRRKLLQAAGLGLVTSPIAKPAIAQAQGPIKIDLIQSMTGPFNDTGKA